MKWGEVTNTIHGCTVAVSAQSTPDSPDRGEGPFVGSVWCPIDNAYPVLRIGNEVHNFAEWWDVQLVKGGGNG